MKRNGLLIALTTFLMALIVNGCNPTGIVTVSLYTEANVTHAGFDFSENKATTAETWNAKCDGETVEWAPNILYVTGEAYGSGVWFRPRKYDEDPSKTWFYDTGKTNLDDVTSVDTSKWLKPDAGWPKLVVNHVYVVQVLDGYVKFQVLAIDHAGLAWPIKIKYQYSQTKNF